MSALLADLAAQIAEAVTALPPDSEMTGAKELTTRRLAPPGDGR